MPLSKAMSGPENTDTAEIGGTYRGQLSDRAPSPREKEHFRLAGRVGHGDRVDVTGKNRSVARPVH
jgi:hypothetical protein